MNARSPIFAYGLAVLLAIFFIWHVYPLTFLAGNGEFFEQGDAAQHVAGWLFYARDTWHFPLLHTERLNHPEGVNIAFTDSIPLAALLFKAIAPWLPSQFHYIGLWHAVAFVSQGLATTFLIRSLGIRHILATLSTVIFALTWPALLMRLGHTALMTHSIILFALAFYFCGRQGEWRGSVTTAAFIVISVVGLTVHPYFLAFCYPLFLAFLADQAIAGEGWNKQWPRLLASIIIICAVGVVLGYFGNGTVISGFSYYSMNLTAPFCGSRFYPCGIDATGGQQYEGYNYFGAGILFLLPFAIVTTWPAIKMVHKRYPALGLLFILFTIYALSTEVYLGSYKLISYALPSFLDWVTGTFRVSGRFFWVVGYAILFATLVALLSKTSWRGILLLALSLLLQWVDVQPLLGGITQIASRPGKHDLASWEKVMVDVNKIHIYPAFGCGDNDRNIYSYFQRLAAHYGKLLDTGYTARPNVNCENNERVFEDAFQQGHLAIMSTHSLENPLEIPVGFRAAAQRGECVKWQDVVLCKTEADKSYWKRSGLQIEAIAPLKLSAKWSADKLPSQIGTIFDGRLVPAQNDKAGFLSFGPYIRLPPGCYRYVIDYASNAELTRQVGRWDVSVSSGKANKEISAGPLHGTAGAVKHIDGIFNAKDGKAPLEIRTFFMGNGDLQIIGISLDSRSDTCWEVDS